MEEMVDVRRLSEVYGNPESWWYNAAETKRIPSYKVGKYRRFRLSKIESWMQAQRQGPRPA